MHNRRVLWPLRSIIRAGRAVKWGTHVHSSPELCSYKACRYWQSSFGIAEVAPKRALVRRWLANSLMENLVSWSCYSVAQSAWRSWKCSCGMFLDLLLANTTNLMVILTNYCGYCCLLSFKNCLWKESWVMALWWCIAFISCHHWVHRSYPPSVLCSTWSSGTCMYRFALGSLVWINSWPQPCLACSIMVLWFLFFCWKAGSFFDTTPAHLVWRICFVFHCWIQLE